MKQLIIIVILFYVFEYGFSQKQIDYKVPPNEIVKLLEAEKTPDILIDPVGEWLLQMTDLGFLSIADLAQAELRIAGLRINSLINGKSRVSYTDSLVLTNLKSGKDFTVKGLPENPKLRNFAWSANGKFVAFTNSTTKGQELWVLDVAKKSVKKLTGAIVNTIMPANPITWVDAGEWLVFTAVLDNKGAKPKKRSVPTGPVVRKSIGKEAAERTYQDLLKDEFDKKLFEYYATSQLVKINLSNEQYNIGIPAIFKEIKTSPDFRFVLVKMIHKPFSYTVPYYRFPFKVEIWDNEGNLFRELFDIPLAETMPKGFGAVRKGPRNIGWRADKPATLYWVWALDGGDPKRKVVTRDRLYLFDFPFDGKGYESIAFKNRFGGIKWGKADFAICSEWWWNTRLVTVSSFNPDSHDKKKHLIFEYNWQDEYNNPGSFITKTDISGHKVLQFADKETKLYLKGKGATPEGYKPFVDEFDIKTGNKERLWNSNDPYYEYPFGFINADKRLILTSRESKTDPPNYFSRNLKNGVVSQITSYSNPYPQLVGMRKELVKYTRNDGVQLTATLYTPPGYSLGDGMLPVLMWAYPNEYKSAAAAGQVKESPNRFVRIGWWSPVFWVMRGYAIFDNPSMPIIGEGSNEPNDTFVEQLVADAEAAVHCIDSLGIADINKIAIGGHSYGAFMAANLLAHSNLFTAGIARSGAYNRSLTPFGFQSEQRTFWEASDTYMEMSPFSYADKINEPLLLIHGNADNNPGTFPMQSERMFSAIKGNGGKVRLVMLPYESHGYKAKESVMHMLWEMDAWLEKFVKQNKQ